MNTVIGKKTMNPQWRNRDRDRVYFRYGVYILAELGTFKCAGSAGSSCHEDIQKTESNIKCM